MASWRFLGAPDAKGEDAARASRGARDPIASRGLQRIDPGPLRDSPHAADGGKHRPRLGGLDRRRAVEGLHRRRAGGRNRGAPPGGRLIRRDPARRGGGSPLWWILRGRRSGQAATARRPGRGSGLRASRGRTSPGEDRPRARPRADPLPGARPRASRSRAGRSTRRGRPHRRGPRRSRDRKVTPGSRVSRSTAGGGFRPRGPLSRIPDGAGLPPLSRAPAGLAAESPSRSRDRWVDRAPRGAKADSGPRAIRPSGRDPTRARAGQLPRAADHAPGGRAVARPFVACLGPRARREAAERLLGDHRHPTLSRGSRLGRGGIGGANPPGPARRGGVPSPGGRDPGERREDRCAVRARRVAGRRKSSLRGRGGTRPPREPGAGATGGGDGDLASSRGCSHPRHPARSGGGPDRRPPRAIEAHHRGGGGGGTGCRWRAARRDRARSRRRSNRFAQRPR